MKHHHKNHISLSISVAPCPKDALVSLERSCGPPVNPEHGKVVVTDHLYRARAEVVCDKG